MVKYRDFAVNCENRWTDRDAVWNASRVGPGNKYYMGM